MKEIIDRLQAHCIKNNIPFVPREGVTDADIETAEKAIGLSFPQEFKNFLKIMNGESNQSMGIIGNWRIMKLEHIIKEWGNMKQMVEEGVFEGNTNKETPFVKGMWWNTKWIPIVTSGSGHFFVIDMDPNTKGKVGQIILFLHDSEDRFLVANSLTEWLEKITTDLENDVHKMRIEDGYEEFNNHAFMKSSIEGQNIYKPKF